MIFKQSFMLNFNHKSKLKKVAGSRKNQLSIKLNSKKKKK